MQYLSCEISYKGYWGIPTSRPEERLAWSGSNRATPEPISRIFYDHDRSQLYYFHLSSLIHNKSQVITFHHWDEFKVSRISPNIFAVRIPNCRRTLQLEVGDPFYRAHLRIGPRIGAQCGWCCLAFGVTAYKPNDTMLTTAYLLRSDGQCRQDNFGYYSHSDDGEVYPCWTVVAKLLDFDQVGSRSGGLICYSRLGTRIAVASGKGVHIWPLEPNEVLKRNVDGYYPPTMQCRLADRDESDVIDNSGNGNASEVKRDANAHQGLVVALKPMSLELDGDCLAMRFLDGEDDLSILTGAGLMTWKLDAWGTGYRLRDWI
ncbi:F-box domain-containing protein [Arthroderma uncinatum]|uniref:F-box domain-containing protein n=1 Tax=Arthroderma uncinatum TaxID=74035 RepID=UPI00144ADB39|nr:F-box domain-containing protein [Arthroderma uncinatum]KAF3481570.1 F-box domain-containing protein [Arthroderma uncinatum]